MCSAAVMQCHLCMAVQAASACCVSAANPLCQGSGFQLMCCEAMLGQHMPSISGDHPRMVAQAAWAVHHCVHPAKAHMESCCRYTQVGNAVCPQVASALGRCLAKAAVGAVPAGCAVMDLRDPAYEEVSSVSLPLSCVASLLTALHPAWAGQHMARTCQTVLAAGGPLSHLTVRLCLLCGRSVASLVGRAPPDCAVIVNSGHKGHACAWPWLSTESLSC